LPSVGVRLDFPDILKLPNGWPEECLRACRENNTYVIDDWR
jgi:hypothetical protein